MINIYGGVTNLLRLLLLAFEESGLCKQSMG